MLRLKVGTSFFGVSRSHASSLYVKPNQHYLHKYRTYRTCITRRTFREAIALHRGVRRTSGLRWRVPATTGRRKYELANSTYLADNSCRQQGRAWSTTTPSYSEHPYTLCSFIVAMRGNTVARQVSNVKVSATSPPRANILYRGRTVPEQARSVQPSKV